MRYALVNPRWSFDGSIYFGCREPHFPLEFGYSKLLLEAAGHQTLLIDAQMDQLSLRDVRAELRSFRPDFTVVCTAPSYLFWRCPPAELRVPQILMQSIADVCGVAVAVGPHGSSTPRAVLRKLNADVVVMGECEEVLPQLAGMGHGGWEQIAGICYRSDGKVRVQGSPQAATVSALPPIEWSAAAIGKHQHHHHRFEQTAEGPGAEMEVSRGCPYHCTFCAKDNFRNNYRKRSRAAVLQELDQLLEAGVQYVYFIDEIFLPDAALLHEFEQRHFVFGVQTRVDLWKPELLELLGKAGCVSLEAGVESISETGQNWLAKGCRLPMSDMVERLCRARQSIGFVQANLLDCQADDPAEIENWRHQLIDRGVWANKPVPLFPYPGSPEYTRKWGEADDEAWERAVAHYLDTYHEFSDIQEIRPLPLNELEFPVRGCK